MPESELIVEFRRGVSEDDARQLVTAAGATVRRRMRTDDADQVMLLVKTSDPAALGARLGQDSRVTRHEPNHGGFGPL